MNGDVKVGENPMDGAGGDHKSGIDRTTYDSP